MVDHVGHLFGVQQTAHRLEMRGAVGAVVIQNLGRFGGVLPARGNLAVQHAQRVGHHAAAAILAQGGLIQLGEPLAQRLAVGGTACGTAQRIELEAQILEAQRFEEAHGHRDQFGVRVGFGRPEAFAVDLVELPHTPLLGTLVAEHGSDGEQLGHGVAAPAAFDIRAHDPGGRFGAQGQGTALAVGEGIHFLLDHVGFRPDAPAEQFRPLEDRSAQFGKAVTGKGFPRYSFHMGESVAVRRKQIGEAFDRGNVIAHGLYSWFGVTLGSDGRPNATG